MTRPDAQGLPVLPPPRADTATTAGNYFVANYPPFSFWKSEHVANAVTRLDQPHTPGNDLGLYVHIPFCRKRCHFCYFKVYTDRNAADIHRYLDAVSAEAGLYAKRRFLGDRPLRFVYFGGGTPSYLSAAQLQYLVQNLRRHLPWDQPEEVTFECEPGTLNEKKVHAIRELGVTRLSLGVENFDEQILELNNRAHRGKEIHAAFGWARAAGFDQVNIDLIAGMLGETDSNWQRCIERTIEMAPDCVTIYQMEIPFNTTIYHDMKESGRDVAPVADWPTKRRWVASAFTQLEQAGYTVTSAYTAVRDAERTRFVYRDALWSGADMIGLGVSSFGHIGGAHFQNQHRIEPYVEAVEAGGLPIYRALAITDDERFIRQFILQLKRGQADLSYFRTRFGQDVTRRFAAELSALAAQDVLRLEGDRIVMTRAGLLEVDRHLHGFFLPQHRGARYA